MKTIWFITLCLCISTSSISAFGDSAGENPGKWELGVGLGMQICSLSITYNSTYSPPMDHIHSVVPVSSTASQVLDIAGKKDIQPRLIVILNRLMSKKLGIQLLGVFYKSTFEGRDNSLSASLDYWFYSWVDSKQHYGSREESRDWTVETDGYLKRNTFSLNLLTRFCLSRHLTVDFSGGLTFFQFSGQVFPLGYAFFITDKASLYLSTYKLILSIEPTVRLGLNIGGELNMSITGSFLLYFTVRYFFCLEASADTRIQKRLNPTQTDLIYNVLEESRAIINPQPIKINPSFLNLGVGLKLRF